MALKIFALILILATTAGAESPLDQLSNESETCVSHLQEEFDLTRYKPKNVRLNLELLQIYSDGRTSIKVTKPSGGLWLKSAQPGGFFD